MAKKPPVTPAVRALRAAKAAYTPHLYDYVERGGTRHSARELGVEEHRVVKTIVLEDDGGDPLIVLMHGDQEVSTKALARELGVKSITPCEPDAARKHTGYLVGGTSPLGVKKRLPVYMQRTITALDTLFLNGGKRGFLVELTPAELERLLKPTLVDAAQE